MPPSVWFSPGLAYYPESKPLDQQYYANGIYRKNPHASHSAYKKASRTSWLTESIVHFWRIQGADGRRFYKWFKEKDYMYCVRPPKLYWPTTADGFDRAKIVKDKLKERFQKSYANQISKQLENGNTDQTLTPVDLRLSFLKPLSAEWLVQVHADIKSDKILIYKGFEKSGIAEAVGYKFSSCEQWSTCIVSVDYSYIVHKTDLLLNGVIYWSICILSF